MSAMVGPKNAMEHSPNAARLGGEQNLDTAIDVLLQSDGLRTYTRNVTYVKHNG